MTQDPMTVDALRPDVSDEGPHRAEPTPLWNESWYFDFADARNGVGGWIRLGCMPNEGIAWITALVSGPQLPTIAMLDFQAGVPADPGQVSADGIELVLTATEPLQEYRVTVRGRGQAHRDPAALLRGDAGDEDDIALEMELTWTTVGAPYQYRLTPRYEIPCVVSGTLTYGGNEIELEGVPGQRDHSWGARDWWSGLEWMWCALHLDDGCHLHAVDARVPGAPNVAIGYLQQPGSDLVELETISVRESFSANGLPARTTMTFDPGGLVATVEFRGHAPVRLVSASGQVSHFPRAWVTVTTADGRTGVGWIEWNRMQRT
jgi:hypothetical protein